jgi:His/Glu/Gln/Arg/opine family amino acid ABC transporter permease subunit
MCLALCIGFGVACVRLSAPRVFQLPAIAYIELFRNTPILVQLYAIYYGLSQVPFVDANVAAIAALSLNYGAYEAENIRGGFVAVDVGQREAAYSLGMVTPQVIWRIILPQALRTIIPPVANDYIYMFKDSAILSLITILELTAQARKIANATFDSTPYIYAALIYLLLSYTASQLARLLEWHLAGHLVVRMA